MFAASTCLHFRHEQETHFFCGGGITLLMYHQIEVVFDALFSFVVARANGSDTQTDTNTQTHLPPSNPKVDGGTFGLVPLIGKKKHLAAGKTGGLLRAFGRLQHKASRKIRFRAEAPAARCSVARPPAAPPRPRRRCRCSRGPRKTSGARGATERGFRNPLGCGSKRMVPLVNIPIPTKVGSKLGGAPTPHWFMTSILTSISCNLPGHGQLFPCG